MVKNVLALSSNNELRSVERRERGERESNFLNRLDNGRTKITKAKEHVVYR